ncbi:MAG: murein biosynthesis integral membrane protein MurJ [Terriglobales bacterium]
MPTTPASTGLDARRMGGAALFMMAAVLASRGVGYLREAYIAYAFGAKAHTDAFVTAFTIPDWLNYLVAGGALSISFITIFSPFLASRREEEGYRVFSIVATFLTLLLCLGIVGGEVWAPQLLRWYVPAFSPAELASCVRMTRILLPAQLFFGLGGLAAALLYARGDFFWPALAPLLYSTAMIAGGVLLRARMGIEGMAVGALVGAIVGICALPWWAAQRAGLRYRPLFHFRDPEFLRWLRLTLPLMVGVTLVTADDWIMRPLAAALGVGAIAHLNFAKQLTRVPIAVLGQAVGQAGMPFFAALAARHAWGEFRDTVDRAVHRTTLGSLLAASWCASLALTLVRLVYQRGQFHAADVRVTALYFVLFVLALAFWSAQGLYSRAFYAAGDTFTPMAAGTIITLCIIPLYIVLAHHLQVVGLVLASDVGIMIHTIAMAVLLHRRGLLLLAPARWRQLPGTLLTALVAGGVTWRLAQALTSPTYHLLWTLGTLCVASAVWAAIVYAMARLLHLETVLEQGGALWRRGLGVLRRA